MFQTIMAVYPWDLVEDAGGAGLDRLRGEVGIDHVALWCASPATTCFNPRRRRKCYFRSDGGLLFRPDPKRYQSTRINPASAASMKDKIPLEKSIKACETAHVRISAIISASGPGTIVRRHPEAACKNAFGDVSLTTLCLVNADVRAFLVSVIADVTSRDQIEMIELTDFTDGWSEAWSVDLPFVEGGDEAVRSLLASCFCESCLQRATACGVDVQAAAEGVRAALQRCFEGTTAGQGEGLAALLSDGEGRGHQATYDAWRAKELASLLAECAQASACPVILVRDDDVYQTRQHQCLDYSHTAGVMTVVEGVAQINTDGSGGTKPAVPRYVMLPASAPILTQTSALFKLFSNAVQTDLSGIQIDHLTALTDSALDALRQAVRYARRLQDENAPTNV